MNAPTEYRKRPVVIEAMEFPADGHGQGRVSDWAYRNGCELSLWDGEVVDDKPGYHWRAGHIKTLEGRMRVNIGDYVIRGVQGEFYPCKPDIFAATYEQVSS